MANRRSTAQRQAFKVTARDLGNLKPGLSLDNIAALIEQVEGPVHRVILINANLALYAYHPRAEHEKSRAWLEAVLSGPELVRFAWPTLWAFLRIAKNPRVFRPSSFDGRG